ncbi:MAG: SCO family protein [SAR324 cluster bacterium]|nr:SCO family protein [SAR324 cluster bacterium]
MRNLILLMISLSFFVCSATAEDTLQVYRGVGGDFTLTGHNQQNVSLENYRGKVVLLTFGYTYCPDVCPLILSALKQDMIQLGSLKSGVQVLFVSVDPERDTPERLKEYVTYFDETFMGLTGSVDEIKKVGDLYRARYFREESPSIAGYFFAHTDYVYLIDQDGNVRGRFKTAHDNEALLQGIQQLLKQ